MKTSIALAALFFLSHVVSAQATESQTQVTAENETQDMSAILKQARALPPNSNGQVQPAKRKRPDQAVYQQLEIQSDEPVQSAPNSNN